MEKKEKKRKKNEPFFHICPHCFSLRVFELFDDETARNRFKCGKCGRVGFHFPELPVSELKRLAKKLGNLKKPKQKMK